MTRTLSLFALALALSLAACGPKPPVYDYASEPDPRKLEYVLGIADGITINVRGNPDLATTATIRPDGTITMPLVGDIKASGETPSSLKVLIRQRLSAFVKVQDSEITVAVTGANSYRFTVSGEVARAGIFTSAYYVTVAEAIALAGGFTRFAKKNEIILMRTNPKTGEVRRIPIGYDFIANGEHPEMNLVLMKGDSLFVP